MYIGSDNKIRSEAHGPISISDKKSELPYL